MGRLSWNVDNDWLASEFADCGEVVNARVQMDRNTGKSRGFGYVEFKTAEAVESALKLNGKEIDGRPVNIDKSHGVDKSTSRDNRAKTFGDSTSPPTSTLFVGNLSYDATEDALWEVFAEYGEVKSIRVPTDRETGKVKGFGYVEFTDLESSKKALEALNGQDIAGRNVRLDYSQPRDDSGGSRGGRGGGGFGGRGGGRGGGRDGGFGGRGGGGFGGRVRFTLESIFCCKLTYCRLLGWWTWWTPWWWTWCSSWTRWSSHRRYHVVRGQEDYVCVIVIRAISVVHVF